MKTRQLLRIKSSGLHAVRNSQPMQPSEVTRIMNMIRMAYERLKTGGSDEDYNRLAAALNVGLIRAEAIDQELVSTFQKAGEAMLSCAALHQKHGKYGFHGPDLLHVNAALEFYEQILTLSSPNQMQQAAEEGAKRIRKGEYHTI